MRQSGILLHITSLPSPGGIGTLGQEAYEFVDFLHRAGMNIWQILPLSPTGFGDSPYQSVSTYAGNPLLIDLRMMVKEGYLPQVPEFSVAERDKVDYGTIVVQKTAALRDAFKFSYERIESKLKTFRKAQPWVRDYALFCAVKEHFGFISWLEWPDEDIRLRKKEAVEHYELLLKELTDYYVFIQYVFFSQWNKLKKYASKKNVLFFGDVPIYVAEDSADVWKDPEVFQLDSENRPLNIAGVPPDFFSADGQRWGNPLYNWKYLKNTGFKWWIERFKAMGELYDIVRVDHFIGFANYYSVPAKETTARNGVWKTAPGRDLFAVVKEQLPELRIVAEDLGAVNKRVLSLMKFCGYPGMKVLSFAFSGNPADQYLPQNYKDHFVVYTGTHDNNTCLGWLDDASEYEKNWAYKVLNLGPGGDFCDAMVRMAMLSRASMCIIPMQDILKLGSQARMNIPGTVGGNWQWRMLKEQMGNRLADSLHALNILSGRGQ